MSDHLIIAPIVLPLLFGALMLFKRGDSQRFHRTLAAIGMVAQLAVAITLLVQSTDGAIRSYALGDWQPPFGIILVLDRLAAYMVLISTLLGSAALLYSCGGQDARGSNFHALFQFQLMGINGAFLTGDIFNLFVFFEILLIASYGLILHSGGRKRTLAGLHYVVLNIAASSFFLIAIGTLYGTLGTLNMADLAVQVTNMDPRRAALVQSAALLLMAVFLLKSAILPLHFWLPRAYAAAPGAVAAIFAIMTKVGIYSILRVYTQIFGDHAGELANFAHVWLWWGGLATLAIGGIGVFSSPDLRLQVSYLTLISVGTMVAALGMSHPASYSALLFYLPHTTFISAGLFLLSEVIGRQRGRASTRIVKSRRLRQPYLLGALYMIGMLGILGLPPFSGALAKTLILFSAQGSEGAWLWPLVLGSTLLGIVSTSRAGTTVFWRSGASASTKGPLLNLRTGGAVVMLIGVAVLMPIFAGPISAYTDTITAQLLDTNAYTEALLGVSIDTAGEESGS